MSTADRAIKMIAAQTGKPVSAIHPHHAIRGDLLDDSLEHVELVMALEDEFGVEISDNDATRVVPA